MSHYPDWTQRPVWVTGLARAGTTLFLSLADGHSKCLAYPDEPSFRVLAERASLGRYGNVEELIADWLFGTSNPMHLWWIIDQRPDAPPGFKCKHLDTVGSMKIPEGDELAALSNQIVMRGSNPEHQAAVLDIAKYHRRLIERLRQANTLDIGHVTVETMLALHESLLDPPSPQRWLFKHPMVNYRPQDVKWFFDSFPRGQIIFCMRDPRGRFSSEVRYDDKGEAKVAGPRRRFRRFFKLLSNLERFYMTLLEAADELGPERAMIVRYEDLIEQTEPTMRRVADYMGLPFEQAMVTPSKLGKPVEVYTATMAGSSEVNDVSLRRWENDFTPRQLRLIEAGMDRFFSHHADLYQPVATTAASRKRLRRAVLPFAYGLSKL